MGIVLEILSGPLAGKKVDLRDGQSVCIGRTTQADFQIPHDNFLSGLHFCVTAQEETYAVRDLGSSNGTYLNGVRVQDGRLKQGDVIRAGDTVFSVSVGGTGGGTGRVSSRVAPGPVRTIKTSKPELLRFLTSRPDPLFALLDAARDKRVLEFLHNSQDMYQSLYQGERGEELASVAPYLVQLEKSSELLEKLVNESWGESWGVYLTCAQPFPAIRRHLRRFLTVRGVDGEKLFFRYYDPRVLRVHLPTCTEDERRAFFGPISSFVMEGEQPDKLLLVPAQEESVPA